MATTATFRREKTPPSRSSRIDSISLADGDTRVKTARAHFSANPCPTALCGSTVDCGSLLPLWEAQPAAAHPGLHRCMSSCHD
jgi:hypothetical protein